MLAFPPDYTFLIQLVSFFVLLYLLNSLLFQPFSAVLVEREERTVGDQDAAGDALASVEEMRARFDSAMAEARAAASAEYESVRKATKAEEGGILGEAQAKAAAELAGMRTEIAAARDEAAAALRTDARSLADDMVKAVLSNGGHA